MNEELEEKKSANHDALQLLSLSVAELGAQVPQNEVSATAAQVEQAEKICDEMQSLEEVKESLDGFITNLQADEGEVLDILSEIADKKVDKLTVGMWLIITGLQGVFEYLQLSGWRNRESSEIELGDLDSYFLKDVTFESEWNEPGE